MITWFCPVKPSSRRAFGLLSGICSVSGSTALSPSARCSGWRSRARCASRRPIDRIVKITSSAVNGEPSCQVTSGRSLIVHCVASAFGLPLESRGPADCDKSGRRAPAGRTCSGSATASMNVEPSAGLNDSPLPPPTWPTRSRPPRFDVRVRGRAARGLRRLGRRGRLRHARWSPAGWRRSGPTSPAPLGRLGGRRRRGRGARRVAPVVVAVAARRQQGGQPRQQAGARRQPQRLAAAQAAFEQLLHGALAPAVVSTLLPSLAPSSPTAAARPPPSLEDLPPQLAVEAGGDHAHGGRLTVQLLGDRPEGLVRRAAPDREVARDRVRGGRCGGPAGAAAVRRGARPAPGRAPSRPPAPAPSRSSKNSA